MALLLCSSSTCTRGKNDNYESIARQYAQQLDLMLLGIPWWLYLKMVRWLLSLLVNPIIRNLLLKMIRWPLNSPMNRIIRNLCVPMAHLCWRDNERIARLFWRDN